MRMRKAYKMMMPFWVLVIVAVLYAVGPESLLHKRAITVHGVGLRYNSGGVKKMVGGWDQAQIPDGNGHIRGFSGWARHTKSPTFCKICPAQFWLKDKSAGTGKEVEFQSYRLLVRLEPLHMPETVIPSATFLIGTSLEIDGSQKLQHGDSEKDLHSALGRPQSTEIHQSGEAKWSVARYPRLNLEVDLVDGTIHSFRLREDIDPS
jgi:hypothetical protein